MVCHIFSVGLYYAGGTVFIMGLPQSTLYYAHNTYIYGQCEETKVVPRKSVIKPVLGCS